MSFNQRGERRAWHTALRIGEETRRRGWETNLQGKGAGGVQETTLQIFI